MRNRGTIGGSLCQADAAEDLSAVCAALKAKVVIRGAGGARVLGLSEFHVGPWMTAVGDGELVTEIRLPLRAGAGSAHEKVERRAGDWAIAAASAAVWMDGDTFVDAGIGLSAVGPGHDRADPRGGAAARRHAVGRAVRAGGGDRRGGLRADPGHARPGRLQAPPRGRAHQTRPSPRHGPRAPAGGLNQCR